MSELVSVAPAIAKRARQRRWTEFIKHFPQIDSMSVLDLGGTSEFWEVAPVQPARLTLLNLTHTHAATPQAYGANPRTIWGNACEPPTILLDASYDLVFSNSVIGHVGGHLMRQRFADTVHNYGNCHWIQTPYRYFPIDAFMACPGFMSMPAAWKAQVSLHWPVGTRKAAEHADAVAQVLGVEFLSRTEMRHYFPQSTIITERMAGMPKSLIAVSS